MGECTEATRVFRLDNKLGMHARPASLFVKTANRFSSDITVRADERTINGKSIIGLLTLAAAHGSTLEVRASGEDAEEALDALEELVSSKFGEE